MLKAADRRHKLIAALTESLRDERQSGKVIHGLQELIAQRVYGIVCGYPDANVVDSVRRIVLHLPAAFPFRDDWHRFALALGAGAG